jgi:hypothetical protein
MIRSHAGGVYFDGVYVAHEERTAKKIIQAHAFISCFPELTPEKGVILDASVCLDVH